MPDELTGPGHAGDLSVSVLLDSASSAAAVEALEARVAPWIPGGVFRVDPTAAVGRGRRVSTILAPKVPQLNGLIAVIDDYLAGEDTVRGRGLGRSPVNVLRYDVGQRYTRHRDVGPGNPRRVLSCLVYLNDGFAGGATYFPEIDRRITPRTGTVVLFDSSLLHEAEPVERGRKYALIAWLSSPAEGVTPA